MHIDILTTPLHFHLRGKSSTSPPQRIPETGMRLMDEMWRTIKSTQTPNTGINHWVYLPDGRMFVGVELQPHAVAPPDLEPLEFALRRYVKHLHVGPYQHLPEKWHALKAELAARGEAITAPSLEIYGHYNEDASKLETTILIGLTPDP